jgi:hypothetical protein
MSSTLATLLTASGAALVLGRPPGMEGFCALSP